MIEIKHLDDSELSRALQCLTVRIILFASQMGPA